MQNYVYVMFNKLSGRYESVMSFPSDQLALHRLNSNVDHEEFELCRIGSISIETGVIAPEPPIRLIWSEDNNLPLKQA